MIKPKKNPKELFMQDDIYCDLRKNNKKFYPIMKNNEQIGEFSFFTMNAYLPITILLKDNLSEKDFVKSYQLFSEIFNKFMIEENETVCLKYYTTNKRIKKNLTRQSRKGKSAIYNSYNSEKQSSLYRNNDYFSEYFFRKNLIGNFFLIIQDNKYYIVNKRQKENLIREDIDFKAFGCIEIPYQIDDIDNKNISLKDINSNSFDVNKNKIFLSLSGSSGDKILSLKTTMTFNKIIFINEDNFQAPKIHIERDDKKKRKEISYYFIHKNFSEITPNNNMIKRLLESETEDVKVIGKKLNMNTNYSPKHISKMIEEKVEKQTYDYFVSV